MFGVNKNGEIKIWCNENFALNFPQIPRGELNAATEEQSIQDPFEKYMVKHLIELV